MLESQVCEGPVKKIIPVLQHNILCDKVYIGCVSQNVSCPTDQGGQSKGTVLVTTIDKVARRRIMKAILASYWDPRSGGFTDCRAISGLREILLVQHGILASLTC